MKWAAILLMATLILGGCGSEENKKDNNVVSNDNTELVDDNTTTEDNNDLTDDPVEDNTSVVTDEDNVSTDSEEDNSSVTVDDSTEDNTTVEEECVEYADTVYRGREVYTANCKVCHAADAKSGLFNISNAIASDIDWAVENVVNMIELNMASKVDAQDRADIAAYLVALRQEPALADGIPECSGSESNVSKITLGNRLFFDTNLSLTGNTACASCHNPGHAFADGRFLTDDVRGVEGAYSVGDDNFSLGGRNAPTAAYAQFSPEFALNSSGKYVGGQFHDGRAATLKEQAKGPFLDPNEMMMPDASAVVNRVVSNSEYVETMKALYGESVFDNTDTAYDAIADAIAAFEATETFAPFDSRYDRSKLSADDPDYYAMSALEQQGYELFFDQNRTHCSTCHTINSESEAPNQELFTNFHYENIGRPKNMAALLIRDGNMDKTDLGLGGRADINDTTLYGLTKVPTLRNVAVTGPYMNNGVFKELRTVLAFYDHMRGEGDHPLNPETNTSWGEAEVNGTVDFTTLQSIPALSDEDIDALEAFLKLLTDKQYEGVLTE